MGVPSGLFFNRGPSSITLMSPKEAFESRGRNPSTGLWVKDWYVIGCVFSSQPVLYQGSLLVGFRTLVCTDAASFFLMHRAPIPAPPDRLTADQVIAFLSDVVSRHGLPRLGVAISHSAWLSSTELAIDPDTAPQGEFLATGGIRFPPMAAEDCDAIRARVTALGVACEFDADNIRAVDP
jgi:hypothetical protein